MGFRLTDRDITVLEAESDQTLAEWWAFLNGTSRTFCVAENIWAVMGWIESKITIRECLWAWNDLKLKRFKSEN